MKKKMMKKKYSQKRVFIKEFQPMTMRLHPETMRLHPETIAY